MIIFAFNEFETIPIDFLFFVSSASLRQEQTESGLIANCSMLANGNRQKATDTDRAYADFNKDRMWDTLDDNNNDDAISDLNNVTSNGLTEGWSSSQGVPKKKSRHSVESKPGSRNTTPATGLLSLNCITDESRYALLSVGKSYR